MDNDVYFELRVVRQKLNERVGNVNSLVDAMKKLVKEFETQDMHAHQRDAIDEANRLVHAIESGGL
jgi:predicted transcriptional regulator